MPDEDRTEDDADDEDDAEKAHQDLAGHVARLAPLPLPVTPEASPIPGVGARENIGLVVGDVAAVRQEPSDALPYRLAHARRPVDPVGQTQVRRCLLTSSVYTLSPFDPVGQTYVKHF